MNHYLVALKCLIIAGILLINNVCLADAGPSCSYERTYCDTIHPTGFTRNDCLDYCKTSSVCSYNSIQSNPEQRFGGFWSEPFLNDPEFKIYNYKVVNQKGDKKFPFGVNVLDYCKTYCTEQEALCDDDECRANFVIQSVDCTQVEDETQRAECESTCHDNILTSECGKTCLAAGISEPDVVKRGCEYLCQSFTNCYVDDECRALPKKQDTHWSLLAILFALLAITTTGLITFLNRKNDSNQSIK